MLTIDPFVCGASIANSPGAAPDSMIEAAGSPPMLTNLPESQHERNIRLSLTVPAAHYMIHATPMKQAQSIESRTPTAPAAKHCA